MLCIKRSPVFSTKMAFFRSRIISLGGSKKAGILPILPRLFVFKPFTGPFDWLHNGPIFSSNIVFFV